MKLLIAGVRIFLKYDWGEKNTSIKKNIEKPKFSLGLCSVVNLGKLEMRFYFEVRVPFKLADNTTILNI